MIITLLLFFYLLQTWVKDFHWLLTTFHFNANMKTVVFRISITTLLDPHFTEEILHEHQKRAISPFQRSLF